MTTSVLSTAQWLTWRALFADKPIEIGFSDPIRSPSFVSAGWLRKFDRAIALPPMGVKIEASIVSNDLFARFSIPKATWGVLTVQHLLAQAEQTAVIAVPNSLLLGVGADRLLREQLVRSGQLSAVVSLSPGLLSGTNLQIALLVLAPKGGIERVRFVRIEIKGLATNAPEQPRRYVAAAPELAVEAPASQSRLEIDHACLAISELKRQANSSNSVREQALVEIVSSHATLHQLAKHLHETAQREIVGFQRLPDSNTHQQERRPGLRIRSVSDIEYVESPSSLESLRRVTSLGEEARIFPSLPIKMFIADGSTGLIRNAGDPDAPVLVVRQSPLLDALCALFELIWERATPIVFTRDGKLEAARVAPRSSAAAEELVPLLAAGLNDKAIAHVTGLSDKTLTRRVAELMKSFDTRTRFQLGWRMALDAFPGSKTAELDRGTDVGSVEET